jgi:hypothetical protein
VQLIFFSAIYLGVGVMITIVNSCLKPVEIISVDNFFYYLQWF